MEEYYDIHKGKDIFIYRGGRLILKVERPLSFSIVSKFFIENKLVLKTRTIIIYGITWVKVIFQNLEYQLSIQRYQNSIRLLDGNDIYEISRNFSQFHVQWSLFVNGVPSGFISAAQRITIGREHYRLATYSINSRVVLNMLFLYLVYMPN